MTAALEPTDLRPLRIVASAIAGRAVEVAAADPGHRSWTDGRTVFLEGGVGGSQRLRLLAVQASLLAAGSLAPQVVRELRRHRALADRYLAVEAHRALAANEAALPPAVLPAIDRALAGRAHSVEGSLAIARHERDLQPGWVLGAIEPRRITHVAEEDDADGAAALAPPRRAAPPDLARLDELDEDDAAAGLDLGNLLSSPVGGGGAVGRLLARLLRPSRARGAGGPPGADAPTHLARGHVGPGRTAVVLTAGSVPDDGDPGSAATHRYPEWDERRRAYRADWCHVVADVAPADRVGLAPRDDAVALRRALAPIGTGPVACRRRRQGDDVDVDALVDARVDHLAGRHGTDEVYVEHRRRRRDLSVLVLLDVSGSAGEPGVGGRPVHEHQREAAAALTGALHRLGDRVALVAFSSSGRRDVRALRVKGFDERLDGTTARRLAGLQPGAYTRLGAAIRHGAALLDAQGGTPRRLLVVLSDGFAYDHGYEGAYGEADARRSLLEARRQGIGCLCLSVGAEAEPAALQRVFGTAAHAAVPTASDLPASIGPLFAAALRSAEAQRRTHQRQTSRTRVRTRAEAVTNAPGLRSGGR